MISPKLGNDVNRVIEHTRIAVYARAGTSTPPHPVAARSRRRRIPDVGTLRAELVRARGADLRDDELGGTILLPRTANADALQLETYWSRPLIQLLMRVMTGALRSPDAFEDVQLEWRRSRAASHSSALDNVPRFFTQPGRSAPLRSAKYSCAKGTRLPTVLPTSTSI